MERFRKMIYGRFGALILMVCLTLAVVVMGGMFTACDSGGGSTGPELTPTPFREPPPESTLRPPRTPGS